MSHLSKTSSDRKAANGVIQVASGVGAASKSRSASVAASTTPTFGQRSATPKITDTHQDASSLVVWERGISQATNPSAASGGVLLTPCSSFLGFVQCMIPVWFHSDLNDDEKDSTGGVRITGQVWCADGDGKIAIRTISCVPKPSSPSAEGTSVAAASEAKSSSAATKPYAKVATIPKYPGAYVTCLARSVNLVWAGYSDGAVRAFCVRTHIEVVELPRRQGAITALSVVQAPGEYGQRIPLLLSSSTDFRIFAHHCGGTTFSLMFQLCTPGACVRSMDSDGDFLYTGGDDGRVRCWSLESKGEVLLPHVYPMRVYEDGSGESIRSLCLFQNSLFVAGGRCAYMVDVVSGQTVAAFNIPAPAAVRCTVIAATFTLWVSGSDGLVYVFDLIDFVLLRIADAHQLTLVKHMEVVQWSPVLHVTMWLPDGLQLIYAEKGRLDALYLNVPPELLSLYEEFDNVEKRVLENRVALKREAATLYGFESLHRQLELRAEEALSGAVDRTKDIIVHGRQTVDAQDCRNRKVFTAASKHLLFECNRNVTHQAFRKWMHFSIETSHQRSQKKLSSALLLDAQETFQEASVRRACRAQYRRDRTAALWTAAADHCHRVHRVQQLRVFHVWKSYVAWNKVTAKQLDVASLLEKQCQLSRVGGEMRRWVAARGILRHERMECFADGYAASMNRAVQERLKEFASRVLDKKEYLYARRTFLAGLLHKNSDTNNQRRMFTNWLSITKQRRQLRLEERVKQKEAAIEQLLQEASAMELQKDVTDEDLDRDIADIELHVSALEAEVRRSELVILQLSDAEQSLKRSAMAQSVLSVHKPADVAAANVDVAVCDSIMQTLLSCGINFRSHWDLLAETQKLATTRPGGTFVKGISGSKTECVAAFSLTDAVAPRSTRQASPPLTPRGGPVSAAGRQRVGTAAAGNTAAGVVAPAASAAWAVNATLVDKANRVVLKRAGLGLREAVVAWYFLRLKLNPDADRIKNIEEIVTNFALWRSILEKDRTLEDAAMERDPRLPWGGLAAGGGTQRIAVEARPRRSASSAVPSGGDGATKPAVTPRTGVSNLASSPASYATSRNPGLTPRVRPGTVVKETAATESAARYPMARRVPPPQASPASRTVTRRDPTAATASAIARQRPEVAAENRSTKPRTATTLTGANTSDNSGAGATHTPLRRLANTTAGSPASPPAVAATATRAGTRSLRSTSAGVTTGRRLGSSPRMEDVWA